MLALKRRKQQPKVSLSKDNGNSIFTNTKNRSWVTGHNSQVQGESGPTLCSVEISTFVTC